MSMLTALLPKDYKWLLSGGGLSLVSQIRWQDMLSRGRVLLGNLSAKRGGRSRIEEERLMALAALESRLEGNGVQVGAAGDSLADLSQPEPGSEAAKAYGEGLLQLYFTQIYQVEGVFLDLRERYVHQGERDELHFLPNQLWISFPMSFQQSLQAVYEGFYHADEKRFEQGLEGMGLMRPEDPLAQREELKTLFNEHFGQGRHGEVLFSLSSFQASFEKILKHFVAYKLSISPEFAFVGIYLTTLYMNLDRLQVPLSAARAFSRAQKLQASA